MTVVAIANVLFDGRMRARFHAESSVQATELLLQERTPRHVSVAHPRAEEVRTLGTRQRYAAAGSTSTAHCALRHAADAYSFEWPLRRHAQQRRIGLQSLGRYRCDTLARRCHARRFRQLHLLARRGERRGLVGWLPTLRQSSPTVTKSPSPRIVLSSSARTRTLTTTMEVVVSPEDDAEVRRVSIANTGDCNREIDVTSYSELTLASPAADMAHPAFSKMFVQTQHVAKLGVLARYAPTTLAGRAGSLGCASPGRGRRSRRAAAIRDRSCALSRDADVRSMNRWQ